MAEDLDGANNALRNAPKFLIKRIAHRAEDPDGAKRASLRCCERSAAQHAAVSKCGTRLDEAGTTVGYVWRGGLRPGQVCGMA